MSVETLSHYISQALTDRLDQESAARVLLVGAIEQTLVDSLDQMGSPRRSRGVELHEFIAMTNAGMLLDTTDRVDAIVFINAFDSVSRSSSEQIISHCRDLLADRVLLIEQAQEQADHSAQPDRRLRFADILSLGLQRIDELSDDGLKIYSYDKFNYRDTPGWLSADNWANPEQWDKHRW